MKNKFSRRVISMLLATVMLLLLLPLGAAATEPEAGTVGVPLGANEAIYSVNVEDDGVTDNVIVAKHNGVSYVMGAISADGKAAAIPAVKRDTSGNNIVVDESTAELFKVSSLKYSYSNGSYWVYSFLTENGYIVDTYGIGEEVQHKLATAEKESVTLDDNSYLWRFDWTPGWYNWNSSYSIYLTVNGEDIHFELGYGTPEAGTEYIKSNVFSKSCQHPNMQYVPELLAKCKQNGHGAYWFCPDCNNNGYSSYFSDEYGLNGSYNPPITLSYGAVDADHDGVCDDCGKNMPVFKKVTEDSQIVAGGKYLLVTKVGDKYYAAATGTEQDGNQLPAVEITPSTDGTFSFEGTTAAMTIELQFAHGVTEWGNGIRYGFITKFNGSLSLFTPMGGGYFLFDEYDIRGAKYGYYVGLNESKAAEIHSAYDENDLMRSYTYNGDQLFTAVDHSEDASYEASDVYLYRLTDTGTVGANKYEMTAVKSETDYSKCEVATAAAGRTNVTGVTDAMTQAAVDNIVSDFVTSCSISEGEQINIDASVNVAVADYSAESGITFSLMPVVIVTANGNTDTHAISDSAFDGITPMTVTLYTGGIAPLQIIHEKHDGTLEIFYPKDSKEAQTGEKIFYTLYDNSGNMYVMFTVTEFSYVKLLTQAIEPNESVKFSSVNISLGKDITVNYFATLPEGYEDAEMRFTMNGVSKTVSGTPVEGSTYKFVYTGVAPQCIGDTITAEIIKGGTVLNIKTYTVKTYLETLSGMTAEELGYSEEKRAAMVKLIKDLLVYGGAAQTYIGHNTGDLVSDGITGSDFTELMSTAKTVANNDGAVKFTGMSLWFDSVNKLIFRFTAADTANVKVGIKAGDGAEVYYTSFTPAGENQYTVMTDGIYATAFDTVYTATIYTDDVAGAVVTYSVNSYVYAMQNSENATMKALARAAYNYGVSAVEFNNK